MTAEKKLYAFYHGFDVDSEDGPQEKRELVGVAYCTVEEVEKYKKKYDRPVVYDAYYHEITCHHVYVEELPVLALSDIKPYGENDNCGHMAVEYCISNEYDEKYPDDRWWDDPEIAAQYEKDLKDALKAEGYTV